MILKENRTDYMNHHNKIMEFIVMAKTKEPSNTSVNPRDLAGDVLDVLETSLNVNKVARNLAAAIKKKDRLESDLEQLKAREKRLETDIRELKENFGAEDSISDMKRLKGLAIELQAVTESIDLIERKLKENGKLACSIIDQKNHLPIVIGLELSSVTARWQEAVDRKVDELLQMLAMYQEAFRIVCKEQDIVPKSMFGSVALHPLLPKIKGFDRVERFTDMYMMH